MEAQWTAASPRFEIVKRSFDQVAAVTRVLDVEIHRGAHVSLTHWWLQDFL